MDEEPKGLRVDRSDRATRLLIDGLDSVTKQLRALQEQQDEEGANRTKQIREQVDGQMKGYVMWLALVPTLLAMITTVLLVVDKMTSPINAAVKDGKAETAARLDKMESRIEHLVEKTEKSAAGVDAVKGVVVDGQTRKEAKQELERRTGETRTQQRKEK